MTLLEVVPVTNSPDSRAFSRDIHEARRLALSRDSRVSPKPFSTESMATDDEVAHLHFEFTQVVLEFGQRHIGFRLQTGVDHHVAVFDANDFSGDDFARAHFGAFQGLFEQGGKRFRH